MPEPMRTLFEVFPHAVAAGLVTAAVCAVIGVFVILKRVVFIGIALSEVAALGVAAALWAHVPPFLGAATATFVAVAILAQPFETHRIPRDAVLGIVFVLASALSMLLVSQSGFGLHEVKALLYGDLILADRRDLAAVLTTLIPVAACVLGGLRPILYAFLDREAAEVLGVRVRAWELLFFVGLGLAVSAASKTAGALLVFCFLVVAPCAALVLSNRLWLVLLVAATLAAGCTLAGLTVSVAKDWPTNPTVALLMCGGFAAACLLKGLLWLAARSRVNRR